MSACRRDRGAERGFSLISAIFLLVVLAGLASYAVRVSVMQQQTVNLALRSAQAFHAARSGAAWAAYRAVSSGFCGPGSTTLTEAGTNGFSVQVSCAQSTHIEGASTIDVYLIDVLAESGLYGGPDYVSRRIQTKVSRTS
jgi:MSHA biogenesis protein MshP